MSSLLSSPSFPAGKNAGSGRKGSRKQRKSLGQIR